MNEQIKAIVNKYIPERHHAVRRKMEQELYAAMKIGVSSEYARGYGAAMSVVKVFLRRVGFWRRVFGWRKFFVDAWGKE